MRSTRHRFSGTVLAYVANGATRFKDFEPLFVELSQESAQSKALPLDGSSIQPFVAFRIRSTRAARKLVFAKPSGADTPDVAPLVRKNQKGNR